MVVHLTRQLQVLQPVQISGNIFACGYIWYGDVYNSTRAFVGTAAVGTPYWAMVVKTNQLWMYMTLEPGAILSTLSMGGAPAFETWCWWCCGRDSMGDFVFGCETAFQGSYIETAGSGNAPTTGVPGAPYSVINLTTFSRSICAISDVRVYQLGAAGTIPSRAVRDRLRLSRGQLIHIPGASLESHVDLIGPNGADTSTVLPIDLTGKRTWTSINAPPHQWRDGPYPRRNRR